MLLFSPDTLEGAMTALEVESSSRKAPPNYSLGRLQRHCKEPSLPLKLIISHSGFAWEKMLKERFDRGRTQNEALLSEGFPRDEVKPC